MEEYTVQDVARVFAVSQKTVYRWIEDGKLSSRKHGIQHFISPANVEKLRVSRQVQPSPDLARLEALEQRLDSLSMLFDVQDLRINELEEKLQRLEQTREPPQPVYRSRIDKETVHPAHNTPASSHAVKSTIPDGYALVRRFNEIHGLKDTTVGRRINEGTIRVTRGEWQHGSNVVRQLLSPEQQREYYQALHMSPGFTRCEKCPHGQE